jgi:DNA-binding transcriptional LysR family regulator
MDFDHRVLTAFDAVATHGGVGRAAQALNATQPTVSRQIKLLERQVGNPLFERDARGMHLTPAGADLLPRVRHILHEMDLARETMDAHRGFNRGSIRIGGVEGVARSILPPILAEVMRRAPHLTIEMAIGSEEQLDRALADRSIDIVFATKPPRDVEAVPVGSRSFKDRCVVFGAADHPLLAQGGIGIADVAGEAWALAHRGATTRVQVEELMRAAGLPMPRVSLQTDSVDAIVAVVATSQVLGWLPQPILDASPYRARIAMFDIPELDFTRTFRAYRRARGTFPPACQVLLDAMSPGYLRGNA